MDGPSRQSFYWLAGMSFGMFPLKDVSPSTRPPSFTTTPPPVIARRGELPAAWAAA